MDPQRWREIERLYHLACEREPGEHEKFLGEACAGDESLRKEVESLLACRPKAQEFIKVPAMEIAARALANDREGKLDVDLVGRSLSHYRILEKIGAGGMGVVYRARDEHLQRDVAIKVLPRGTFEDESALKRFRKEALALSKLNHPNIETVYDFDTQDGIDFLAMEYVPGITLSDRLASGSIAEKEVLALGMQIAAALEEAHEKGVVHRDLKPANIILTPKDQVKVLDFGLAKLLRPASESVSTESLSGSHAVVGTLPYMAPEQLRGEPADSRTDIHAAGVLLYEMCSGRRPFHEDTVPKLTDAILHQAPVVPRALNSRLSPQLEGIVLKCLEKEPEHRYQSARELLVDLRRTGAAEAGRPSAEFLGMRTRFRWALIVASLMLVGSIGFIVWQRYFPSGLQPQGKIMLAVLPPPSGKIMLAALPVENLSGDPNQEYFSDGLTEEMIAQLGRLQPQRLGIIARTSVMQYKGTKKPIGQIGRELGVDYILESSMRREAGRVRITAQLIQVHDQIHLWADTYERRLAGIFAVQSEVSQRVARSLAVELLPGEQNRLASARPVNPEAYDLYLKGRYHWNKRTAKDLLKAAEYFQAATGVDPTYALAYAGLGDSYALYSFYGVLPARESFPQARAAAAKALEFDGSFVEAQTTLAFVSFYYDWDWAAAETRLKHVLELRPGYTIARQWYAEYLVAMGRDAAAMPEIKRAQESDPLSPLLKTMEGYVYCFAGRHEQAIEACQRALPLDPNYAVTYLNLGRACEAKGLYGEAMDALQRAYELSGGQTNFRLEIARLYARSGRRLEATKILCQILSTRGGAQHPTQTSIAMIYAALGENDEAMVWLEEAYQERAVGLVLFKVDPGFDPLRDDPRFQALLRKMNFPK